MTTLFPVGLRGSPFLLSLFLATLAPAQSTALPLPKQKPQPRSNFQLSTPLDFFRRADDLTNIRLPGMAPFHMKVTFHAYPAYDFNRPDRKSGSSSLSPTPVPGHPFILAGDGTYEENWVTPEEWRREVTFGSYHAIEVRAHGVRKFLASSDYEPSRVAMLLRALFNPIPRFVLEQEADTRPLKWKLEHLAAGSLSYVRISHIEVYGQSEFAKAVSSHEFLPSGIPVRSSDDGITTSWQDDSVLNGKLVPGRITIETLGNVLLDARVTIASLSPVEPALFDLAGDRASPGLTLLEPTLGVKQDARPVYQYAPVFPPELGAPPGSGVRVQVTIDRSGLPREMEMVETNPLPSVRGPNPEWLEAEAAVVLKSAQRTRYHPAEIDNDPCEVSRIVSAIEGSS
ncbi:MAG TPA: hypothetical protein VIY53_11685 [Acidobacteriaceae bacterium]